MRFTVNLQDGTSSRPDAVRGPEWLTGLINHLNEVRQYSPPAPLWRTRRALNGRPVAVEPEDVRQAFAMLVLRLHATGYLAHELGAICVDAERDEYGQLPHNGKDSQDRILAELQRLLGTEERGLWPPAWDLWDTDTFYELIEAWHDLVARPRRRWIHEHDVCGVHFEDFDPEAGRRIYRILVNRLLSEREIDLQLAGEGEDEGRLVHVIDDARADLLARARLSPDRAVGGAVDHAIALFRARGATEHDKRSAITALARVLEKRRELLKANLFRADEGALFDIANCFDLRHSNDRQHTNYSPAFHAWVFWWYLATVELTDRLLARDASTPSIDAP